MARGGKGKSNEKKPEGLEASAGHDSAAPSPRAAGKASSKKDAQIEKGRRQQLKRLETQLTAAAKDEAKRVRKLEKARWRRQKLQAAVVEVNSKKAPKLPAAEPKRPKQLPAAKAAKAPKAPKAPASAKTKKAPAAARTAKVPKGAGSSEPATAKTPRQRAPKPKAPAPSAASSGSAPATAEPVSGAVETAVVQPAAGATVVEAYCLREKKRVPMLDPKRVVTANGGAALSGTCPSCGAALYKLVGRKAT